VALLRSFSSASLKSEIDEELQRFAERIDWIDWTIFPPFAPKDLPIALDRKGLRPGSSPWMMAELRHLPPPPVCAEGFRVESVLSDEAMSRWHEAAAAGFGWDLPTASRYRLAYPLAIHCAKPMRVHYVGYWNQVPVSTSTLLLAGGVACIYDVATAPEHRHRAYGSCVTRAALDEARRRGFEHACLMTSPQARTMYRALGFPWEFDVPEWRWTAAD
jgi:GNAT superfamily N-acetyltransferase